MLCVWCGEPLSPLEPRYTFANGPVAHRACALRQVVGSVAHLEGRCGCVVPGSPAGDPPGLTRRQAAEAAVVAWRLLGEAARTEDDAL